MPQRERELNGCLGRRRFLALGAAVPALAGMSLTHVSAQEPGPAAGKADPNAKWGIPGPYPGRVVEVRHSQMIKNDVKNREAIHQAVGARNDGADRRHRRSRGLAKLLRAR